MKNNNTQEWRPCPSWPSYEVNEAAEVKRLPHSIIRKPNGPNAKVKSNGGEWNYKGGILKQQTDELGYKIVALRKDGKTHSVGVHRLVAEAWKVEGWEEYQKNPKEYTVDHFPDRDPSNNLPENLRYASKSQQRHNSDIQRNNQTGYKGVSVDKRRETSRSHWSIEKTFKSKSEAQLLAIASETGGKLMNPRRNASGGLRPHPPIKWSSFDEEVCKRFKTEKEAAIARDKKVLEIEQAGFFKEGDVPLNFPELRLAAA